MTETPQKHGVYGPQQRIQGVGRACLAFSRTFTVEAKTDLFDLVDELGMDEVVARLPQGIREELQKHDLLYLRKVPPQERSERGGRASEPVDVTRKSWGGSGDELTAAEAAQALGVKRQTLYVYVSRGMLRSVPGAGNERLYPREDVMRLKAKGDARAGRPISAIGALHYGEPVIESSITLIDVDKGPVYRGHSALELARRGCTKEQVASLLWTGVLPEPAPPPFVSLHKRLPGMRLVEEAESPLSRIEAALFFLAKQLPRYATPQDLRYAEGVLAAIDDVVGHSHPVVSAVLADHELNPSAFAARVAASTGAGLVACLQAALATFSGPRHGGACDRIEALLDEIGTGKPGTAHKRAAEVVRGRLSRGEEVPGFFSAIYKRADPRTAILLEQPEAKRQAAAPAHALIEAMREASGPEAPGPSSDLAFVALARGAGWPKGVSTAVFAAARLSGWIAHVFEQRASGEIVRPRARFTG